MLRIARANAKRKFSRKNLTNSPSRDIPNVSQDPVKVFFKFILGLSWLGHEQDQMDIVLLLINKVNLIRIW